MKLMDDLRWWWMLRGWRIFVLSPLRIKVGIKARWHALWSAYWRLRAAWHLFLARRHARKVAERMIREAARR